MKVNHPPPFVLLSHATEYTKGVAFEPHYQGGNFFESNSIPKPLRIVIIKKNIDIHRIE